MNSLRFKDLFLCNLCVFWLTKYDILVEPCSEIHQQSSTLLCYLLDQHHVVFFSFSWVESFPVFLNVSLPAPTPPPPPYPIKKKKKELNKWGSESVYLWGKNAARKFKQKSKIERSQREIYLYWPFGKHSK